MGKHKKLYKNIKFQTLTPKWNDRFEFPDGSCFVSDIQDYFEHIIKNHKTFTDNSPVRIYVNKIEKRIMFKIKKGYYVELLTLEAMKLLTSTKSRITKGKNVPHLEVTEVVLVHCNIANNNYQKDLTVFYTFITNKLFGQLLDIFPKNLFILRIL